MLLYVLANDICIFRYTMSHSKQSLQKPYQLKPSRSLPFH